MARPKLGESESKRLQMVITEDELSAIDEWQHANHVASRSEAIRRLVQIGLRTNAQYADLYKDHRDAFDALSAFVREAQDVFRHPNAKKFKDEMQRLFTKHVKGLLSKQVSLDVKVLYLLGQIQSLSQQLGFDESVRKADAYQADIIKDTKSFLDMIETGKRE